MPLTTENELERASDEEEEAEAERLRVCESVCGHNIVIEKAPIHTIKSRMYVLCEFVYALTLVMVSIYQTCHTQTYVQRGVCVIGVQLQLVWPKATKYIQQHHRVNQHILGKSRICFQHLN